MESRKSHRSKDTGKAQKSTELPIDYTKMVADTYAKHFEAGLQALAEHRSGPSFQISGRIFPNEVVFCASIVHEGELVANSFYGSCDFDPKASAPTAEDILGHLVDTVGALVDTFLDPKAPEKIQMLAQQSMNQMSDVPFEWTELEETQYRTWVKMDKSNPGIDAMTENWLAQNDPKSKQTVQDEDEEAGKNFRTGESAVKGDNGSDT